MAQLNHTIITATVLVETIVVSRWNEYANPRPALRAGAAPQRAREPLRRQAHNNMFIIIMIIIIIMFIIISSSSGSSSSSSNSSSSSSSSSIIITVICCDYTYDYC